MNNSAGLLPLFFKTATMGAHQSVGIFTGQIVFFFLNVLAPAGPFVS